EAIEGEDLVPLVHVGTEAPRLKVASSLSGICVGTGELQRCDDTLTDTRLPQQPYRDLGIRSILVVPLRDEQRTLGVLKVVSSEPHAFTDRDAKALRLLGGLMGAALGHAAAFEGRQARLEERTQALQESEQRFKQLVDVAQEGIWVADDRGVITYVNQRMADLLGYGNGGLLGRPVFDFIDADSKPGAQRTLSRHGSRPGFSQDLRFRRCDGSQLWGLVSSSPILGRDGVLVGTVGMLTDITERKRTEDQLRRSADRLAMLHDMDQAILAAQSPSEVGRAALGRMRRMVSCQRCTVVLFDFERREAELIAGYSSGVQLSPASISLEELPPAETLRAGSVRYVEDLTALQEPAPALLQLMAEGFRSVLSAPLLVEGEVIGEINLASTTSDAFSAEHRDIALEVANPLAIAIQHARLREEVSRQAGELERRLGEKGAALRATTAELETLLYSVSHDVRAPLRHLIGFSRLLLDDFGKELDAGALHYAERIHQAADQMATLIDDLVGLSRIGRQDLLRREVRLSTLVEDVVDQLRSQTNGRSIDWQIEELPVVDADPGLARIAVTHLLSNAIKFTRPRQRAEIRIAPVQADGQTGLAVRDNGVGFKMAYAGKLFGMFQRLHRPDEFEGNGAGLAIVQRIAHKHGGRVWVEAEPDAGATFFLTLGSGEVGKQGGGEVGKRVSGEVGKVRGEIRESGHREARAEKHEPGDPAIDAQA
ncbi:MAG TPA: GAF domain-containing protein, partial [Gemmatimonadales bacterium]|nr:GAF domain-containing protein [Gemmatimonadales bacterium]